jgi:hypothetical protein
MTIREKKSIRRAAEHGGQARVNAVMLLSLWNLIVALAVAAGSFVMAPVSTFGPQFARTPAFNIGVSPTSMQTSNLPQSTVVYHDKNFVKNLKANTPFLRLCTRRELPENSGNQHRLYMYNTLAANITQQAEGTVGSGITVQVVNNTSTIGQYADYVNVSDLSLATAIDPALENIQKELSYRLALTISTIVRNTADGAAAVDASVNKSLTAVQIFGKNTITSMVQSLAGKNAHPFQGGRFTGAIHPFIVGDALNDTTNNSITDVLKRSAEGQEKLMELPAPDGDDVQVLDWAGVSFHQTTMVTQTANYLASGSIALRTYIVGEDGLIAISLGKKESSQIGDGDWRNLKLWMYKQETPTPGDPARVIGGWTSYNVKFTATLPPDPIQRIRYSDAVSQIS